MFRRAIVALPWLLVMGLLLAALPAAAQPSCESLAGLSLPGIAIKSAANVPADSFMLPNAAQGAPARFRDNGFNLSIQGLQVQGAIYRPVPSRNIQCVRSPQRCQSLGRTEWLEYRY